jgi:Tfp pilus assembly protein PilO
MLSKNWTKSTPAPRNIAFAALVLMGAIAVYNRVVAPHANYVLAAQRYESVANKLTRKNQAIIDDMKIKGKKLEGLEEKLEQMRTNLFEPIEAKEFFSDIEVMSEGANCTIYSLDVSQTRSALKAERSGARGYITANHAKLSVVGSYRNIVVLMNKLQGSPRQVWINSVSIKPISDSSEQLKCDISIVIYTTEEKGTVL